MATTETKTDPNVRKTIGEWYFEFYWHSKTVPTEPMIFEYTKALMNLAGADGVLADEERQWVLGNGSAKGISDESFNFFKTYMPTKADIEKMMVDKPTFAEHVTRALLFEAFLAASADKELHKDERDAIYRLGEILGEDKKTIEKLEVLAANEKKHRDEVVSLVFPQGLKQTLVDIKGDFKDN